MTFPQEFIERVRESTNIVDLIGQYVQLRRTSGNYMGLCPFHGEKSPSFSVSEDKQVYHCFGCKKSGNAITFVQDYQGLTFPETIEYLAKRASLPLPERQGDSGRRDIKQSLFRVNALAAQFYHEKLTSLPESHPARKYLVTRGLTDELVKAYKIGYAPDGWTELATFFERKKVPLNLSEQLGLLKRRTGEKSGHYDLFRHRLMFPIFSPTGDCVGFGGRVLSADQQPKYLNSIDSAVFHKGRVFYGLDHSAKYIRSEDEAIVVEGYMDWLALAKVSVNHIVATLGTALTPEHAKAIKRYSQRVLLLFDGDAAGQSAAARSLPILLSEGLHARGLILPDKLDPDDFLQKYGVADLRARLAAAPDLFDLVTNQAWLAAKGAASGKVQLMDEFAPVLAGIADPRYQQLYARNFANLLDVDPRLVQQSVKGLQKGSQTMSTGAKVTRPNLPSKPVPSEVGITKSTPSAVETQAPVIQFDLTRVPRAELEILNLMLMREVYLKEALASGVGEKFAHPGARGTYLRIAELYGQMPNKFDNLSALLANEVKPFEMVTRHLSEPFTSYNEETATKLLRDCIKRVEQATSRSKLKELVSGLRAGGNADQSNQLEQIMNIYKTRRSTTRDS